MLPRHAVVNTLDVFRVAPLTIAPGQFTIVGQMAKPPKNPMHVLSSDPLVNHANGLAAAVMNGAELTQELREAIARINAEAAKRDMKDLHPEPRYA
jgi:hypothetical protein